MQPREPPRTAESRDEATAPDAWTRRGVLAASAAGVFGTSRDPREGTGAAVPAQSTSLASARANVQSIAAEWTEATVLTAGDAAPNARFGYSVAIDGERALVGADTDDERGAEAGAAYLFEFDGERWRQVAKLTADDAGPGDRFGDVVALDEGYAVVGARRSDSRGSETGAVYVFAEEGGRWRQIQKLVPDDGEANDRFGRGIAVEGDRALVGARRNDAGGKDAGAAYVFERYGDRWVQTQKLTAGDADPDDRFGRVVALDASRALVGTRLDDERAPDAGAVYVFETVGGRWRQTQKLVAEDGDSGDNFGDAVSLGGDQLLVGASRDDESAEDGGAVYSFAFDAGEWRPAQKLAPADPAPGTRFGSAVAHQRQVAVVGAQHDSERARDAGAVFVFQRDENRWRQHQKLTATDPSPDGRFGSAVALDGDRILVGAVSDDAAVTNGGAVYVFTLAGTNGGGSAFLPSLFDAVVVGGALAVLVTVAAAFRRDLARFAAPLRRTDSDDGPPAELLSDEERVLELLEDRGGRMKQRAVREALGWSETKTSTVVTRMRAEGSIEVYRLGNENTLALPGELNV